MSLGGQLERDSLCFPSLTYGIGMCRARGEHRLGALGAACAGDSWAGGARAHGACAKGSRNAGSSVESLQGGIQREGSFVLRLHFSFKKMEVGRERGS